MALPAGNGPVPYASGRPSPISMTNMTASLYVEGHGEWRTNIQGHYAGFRVPDGVQIVIYQGIGVGLDNQHGIQIAQGQAMPNRLPTLYDAHNGEYDTELPATGGAVRQNTPGRRIYYGGEMCPDLTLLAPNEPGYAAFGVQAGSYTAGVGIPQQLRAIAEAVPHGTQIRWACCTVYR